MPLQVHYGDDGLIVPTNWMIEEGNPLSVARKSWMAYPPRSFVQDFTHRISQPVDMAIGDKAHYGEVLSIRSPVGILHRIQDGTRRASADREPRQCAHPYISRPDGFKSLEDE